MSKICKIIFSADVFTTIHKTLVNIPLCVCASFSTFFRGLRLVVQPVEITRPNCKGEAKDYHPLMAWRMMHKCISYINDSLCDSRARVLLMDRVLP